MSNRISLDLSSEAACASLGWIDVSAWLGDRLLETTRAVPFHALAGVEWMLKQRHGPVSTTIHHAATDPIHRPPLSDLFIAEGDAITERWVLIGFPALCVESTLPGEYFVVHAEPSDLGRPSDTLDRDYGEFASADAAFARAVALGRSALDPNITFLMDADGRVRA